MERKLSDMKIGYYAKDLLNKVRNFAPVDLASGAFFGATTVGVIHGISHFSFREKVLSLADSSSFIGSDVITKADKLGLDFIIPTIISDTLIFTGAITIGYLVSKITKKIDNLLLGSCVGGAILIANHFRLHTDYMEKLQELIVIQDKAVIKLVSDSRNLLLTTIYIDIAMLIVLGYAISIYNKQKQDKLNQI